MKEEGRCHPDTTNAEKQQSIYMNKISKNTGLPHLLENLKSPKMSKTS